MTTDERLDRRTGIVETLASAVTAHDSAIDAHDRQIGAVIGVVEKQGAQIAGLKAAVAATQREWRAYIKTLLRR
ncbi:MAG: hypothetical protein LAP87_25245 [Acidobacteriia bacterium]|nr:hypothetical protein [Terriglobia bacterium]